MMLPDFKLKSSYIHPLSWDVTLFSYGYEIVQVPSTSVTLGSG